MMISHCFRYLEHKGIDIFQVAKRDCTMVKLDSDEFQQFQMQITKHTLTNNTNNTIHI